MKESEQRTRESSKSLGAVSATDYLAALQSYLEGAGETALDRAYEIGRAALGSGTGLLALAQIHHAALETLLLSPPPPARRQALTAAAEFYSECISPYEMTYRGFHEANVALRHFNEGLEREAKRIAYALHSEAGQLLAIVYIALAEIAREVPPPVKARLSKVTALLDQIEAQLRRLSHELRPAILDDLGLLPALRYLSEGVSQRAGLPISVEGTLEERLLPSIESALYRVAQEALSNSVRHAQASSASIRIERDAQSIRCSIRDNGIGFDSRSVMARSGEQGFGLLGIRERLNAVGGTLQINSAAGAGTALIITIPYEDQTDAEQAYEGRAHEDQAGGDLARNPRE
jgi:signal transduction histidine kinase